jgi:hypothetical protein
MSRQISPSQPSFHLIWSDYEWPDAVYHIAENAIEAFHGMVNDKKWPILHDLFMTSAEKWNRDEQNSNQLMMDTVEDSNQLRPSKTQQNE